MSMDKQIQESPSGDVAEERTELEQGYDAGYAGLLLDPDRGIKFSAGHLAGCEHRLADEARAVFPDASASINHYKHLATPEQVANATHWQAETLEGDFLQGKTNAGDGQKSVVAEVDALTMLRRAMHQLNTASGYLVRAGSPGWAAEPQRAAQNINVWLNSSPHTLTQAELLMEALGHLKAVRFALTNADLTSDEYKVFRLAEDWLDANAEQVKAAS